MADGAETRRSAADLYAGVTEFALRGKLDGSPMHRGLWGPDTRTDEESAERACRTLVQGCKLGPGQHVLDAGCGLGGTAIPLARIYGVRVTGLTNCAPHIAPAAQSAKAHGVGHLVEFRYGDFMHLPFPDASFDVAVNHEAFSYADDKLAYLQGIYRVLKPGGRWQALDLARSSDAPLSEEQDALAAGIVQNWCLSPVLSWRTVVAVMNEAGFVRVEEQDLTAEAMPSTERIRQAFLLYSLMNPNLNEMNPPMREFMDASVWFAEALSQGIFTYHFFSGTRPLH